MSLVRRALVLDSEDDLSPHITDLLEKNGYVVHVIVREERAGVYVKRPVYIHVSRDEDTLGEDLERVVGEIELALLLSPDEERNMAIGRALRSRGVPVVIVSVRSSESEREARESGLIPVNIARTLFIEVMNIIRLKYSRIILIDEYLGALSMYVTADSRLIGESVGELEERYGVRAAVVRDGVLSRDPETVVQEGDRVIAIGHVEKLKQLASL